MHRNIYIYEYTYRHLVTNIYINAPIKNRVTIHKTKAAISICTHTYIYEYTHKYSVICIYTNAPITNTVTIHETKAAIFVFK